MSGQQRAKIEKRKEETQPDGQKLSGVLRAQDSALNPSFVSRTWTGRTPWD